ncbi:MAG: hypothetical protein RIC55_25950 [Pirellulaceae bacterium]
MSLPDPSRHMDQRNWVETVLRYIPGFRGYLEKEFRRESDSLAREWMAGRLRQGKTGLDNLMRGLVDAGQIDALPQFERVRSKLDHLTSSILGSVNGYSGFFDFVRVDEEMLDDVYQLDAKLMEEIDRFANHLQELGGKPEEGAKQAGDLISQVEDLQQKQAKRGELLRGVERSES